MDKIGLGGGCHWCTEAVFQSLRGVSKVEQGFVSPKGDETSFSEAIIVHYAPKVITLKDLIAIHLLTHKSTLEHSIRGKYRSAIYTFDSFSDQKSKRILFELQKDFEEKLITKVMVFGKFRASDKRFHNYYYNNPKKPFCETYIEPKLALLRNRFAKKLDDEKSIG